MRRNTLVEDAVERALARVDFFISGGELQLPQPRHRKAIDDALQDGHGSTRAAILFLAFYRLIDRTWNLDTVPTGVRGKYGDKRLCEELTTRNITLHNVITAFGENLGWKGNVREFRLLRDSRFGPFLDSVKDAGDDDTEVELIADYVAHRFAESRRKANPLPPVGSDVLTFPRAKVLFHRLLSLRSEGHIQQFLVAALLSEYRRRHGVDVRTHHPHAADKYDDTAGDIEEFRNGQLVRAYEVTVRDDWQNRLSAFRGKMDRFALPKYVIIAAGVNSDAEWSVPATMALRLEDYGRDIAVVDILDVVNVLAAELAASELRGAVNGAYELLTQKQLSGRVQFIESYSEAVSQWLDDIT